MCSMNDDPSMHDEPLEDSVDWLTIRQIRDRRMAHASREERENGLPQRIGWEARYADHVRASHARRGRNER